MKVLEVIGGEAHLIDNEILEAAQGLYDFVMKEDVTLFEGISFVKNTSDGISFHSDIELDSSEFSSEDKDLLVIYFSGNGLFESEKNSLHALCRMDGNDYRHAAYNFNDLQDTYLACLDLLKIWKNYDSKNNI